MSVNNPIIIIKADGTKEEFHDNKLRESLRRSGASQVIVDAVTDHIKREIQDGMSTKEIYSHAFSLLRKMEHPTAIKYSLRRAIADLGPSGFPFEKFVAEIFKAKGYETLTDQVVFGHCVSHEVDVVAWNDRKLIMSEVKFHNELGLKSDLKVALYVKARFEDISSEKLNYGGIERNLNEGILITNTKFSEMAVRYAECSGLRLIGWNYPRNGNLLDMIEDAGLHPITSLTSLTHEEKNIFLQSGIVLCQSLIKDPSIFRLVSLSKEKEKIVLEESEKFCGNPSHIHQI